MRLSGVAQNCDMRKELQNRKEFEKKINQIQIT